MIYLLIFLSVATISGDALILVQSRLLQKSSEKLASDLDDQNKKSLREILKQVKAGQEKTDGVADQAVQLGKQNKELGQQNAQVVTDLKKITESHTKDIKATRIEATSANSAAKRANANTIKTQKTVNEPFYKKFFK